MININQNFILDDSGAEFKKAIRNTKAEKDVDFTSLNTMKFLSTIKLYQRIN